MPLETLKPVELSDFELNLYNNILEYWKAVGKINFKSKESLKVIRELGLDNNDIEILKKIHRD